MYFETRRYKSHRRTNMDANRTTRCHPQRLVLWHRWSNPQRRIPETDTTVQTKSPQLSSALCFPSRYLWRMPLSRPDSSDRFSCARCDKRILSCYSRFPPIIFILASNSGVQPNVDWNWRDSPATQGGVCVNCWPILSHPIKITFVRLSFGCDWAFK